MIDILMLHSGNLYIDPENIVSGNTEARCLSQQFRRLIFEANRLEFGSKHVQGQLLGRLAWFQNSGILEGDSVFNMKTVNLLEEKWNSCWKSPRLIWQFDPLKKEMPSLSVTPGMKSSCFMLVNDGIPPCNTCTTYKSTKPTSLV